MRGRWKAPIQEERYLIDWRTVGMFQTNSFLVACPKTREGVLIDASGEFPVLKEMITSHGVTIRYLLQTHAHLDHVAALAEMKAWTGAPIVIHKDEMPLYEAVPMQCRLFGLPAMSSPPPPDIFLHEGDTFDFGELSARAIMTPGHTPGGVTFAIAEHLFVGDTLFQGSIGRTDLPGGDMLTLLNSIQGQLLTWPDETLVFSGHGFVTTIGNERRTNPFL